MEQKYYAPATLSCLTLTQHPGTLTRADLSENLMRMLEMDKTEKHDRLTAEEAQTLIDQMSREEYKALQSRAETALNSQEMQEYLQRKQITVGDPLSEINPSEVNEQEIMDEFSLAEFEQTEMPMAYWD